MSGFANVIIYSFAAGLAMMLGVFLVRRFGGWSRRNTIFLISFAAGILLANAFLHLLPQSIKLTNAWPYWVLGTVIVFYLIEHAIIIHCCAEKDCEVHTALGSMGLVGIGFHSLIDGITIGIAFQAGFTVGLLASLAVIFHKVAEGICIYGLLIHDKLTQAKARLYSWLVALATPVGATLAYLFIRQASAQIEGWLLATAAGSFIYIGASDLVPATHQKQNFLNIVLLLVGILFVLLIGFLN